MDVKQYIVDAFADRLFAGNQAAVCLPDKPMDEKLMQKIAIENNFSETAFVVRGNDGYNLRWFTPGGEIDLCGHATLGAAFVMITCELPELQQIEFSTGSGILTVRRDGGFLVMDFPQAEYREIAISDDMADALGVRPSEAYIGRDLMMVLHDEDVVRKLKPDFRVLKSLPGLLQCVTAKGRDCDCISRVFAPKLEVAEDPVTGSAHCMIAPYWAKRLNLKMIDAEQASPRGGRLLCRPLSDGRIEIAGQCVLYAKGTLYL